MEGGREGGITNGVKDNIFSVMQSLHLIIIIKSRAVVAHTFNPSTHEAETDRSL